MSEVVQTCGAVASNCVCAKPKDHPEQVHACANPDCLGEWTGTYDTDDFTVVRWPGMPEGATTGEAFVDILFRSMGMK